MKAIKSDIKCGLFWVWFQPFHFNTMITKFWGCIAILLIAGCATDPAVLASRKLDGETLTSHAWITAVMTSNVSGHSCEIVGSCKFSADGTGVISSRRFGYTRPGTRILDATGIGAYTEVISWPISWEALGNGEIELECSDEPTSTGPNFGSLKPLALASAKLSGKTLVLMYTDGKSTTNQATDPNDSRLNLTKSEISSRLASWASKGPKMLAKTDANIASAPEPDPFQLIGIPSLSPMWRSMNEQAKKDGGSMTTIIQGSGGNVMYSKHDNYSKKKK